MLYFELLNRIERLDAQEVRAIDTYLAGRTPTPQSDAARALLNLRLGDPVTAGACAERAANAGPIEAVASYTLALYAAQRRDWERALALLAELPADFVLAGEGRALRAAILLTLGRVDESRELCADDRTASDATRGALAGIAAQCAMAGGDGAAAREAVASALRFSPDVAWLRATRRSFPVPAGAIPTVRP